ncbi:hypothetical protein VPHK250G1_0070 [Vibrio phage K250 g1]
MDDQFVNMFGNAVAIATATNYKRYAGDGWKAKLFSYAYHVSEVITRERKRNV